jgi:hypothetical protein
MSGFNYWIKDSAEFQKMHLAKVQQEKVYHSLTPLSKWVLPAFGPGSLRI